MTPNYMVSSGNYILAITLFKKFKILYFYTDLKEKEITTFEPLF